MKHTFKYILFISALFSFSMTSYAQDVRDTYHNEGKGVATGKQVSGPNDDGSYTITLETFATGESVSITQSLPADIVLVLDLSQSMTYDYGSSTNYTPRASSSYSYQNYGNNQYYYQHTDGEYYQVSRGYYETDGTGNNATRHYYLTFEANGTTYYLYGNTVTTERPSEPSGTYNQRQRQWQNTGETIWTGVLYNQTTTNISRLQALQTAVDSFLEVIYHNDIYEDETNSKLRGEPLGNKLSIVTYGGPQGNTNVTRINSGLTPVSNADRSKNTSMITDLLALTNSSINNSQHYGTYSDEGMVLANSVLDGISAERKENSSRTVVLFTDGAPGSGPGWTTGNGKTNSSQTSNRTIAAALTAKSTHEATVFTVVLGGIANQDMDHYLQYTSSNYPEAESLTIPHDAGEKTTYALEAGDDLEGVFTTIASQSGGSSQSIPASSQVRDVVSSSFNLPEGFNANSVTVYTVDVKPSGQEFYGPDDSDYAQHKHPLTVVTSQTGEGEANADYLTNEEKVLLVIGSDRISVEGFDYSKGDGDELGSGNWVGPRISGSQSTFYGKKLVIEFNIEPETDATGGDATNTNAAGSGVYVLRDGQYVSVNDYEPPHTDLPTVIKISKKGLRRGESATFQIVRYRPIGWNEDDPADISNYQWTVVGKPMPDPDTQEDFSKVILTNKKGDENTEIVKTLMALDPSWIYEVYEDDWAWSYTYDGSVSMTTSDVEVNPFRFTNSKNEEAVKHAEAVSINHFANGTLEASVENIKSNETFDTN